MLNINHAKFLLYILCVNIKDIMSSTTFSRTGNNGLTDVNSLSIPQGTVTLTLENNAIDGLTTDPWDSLISLEIVSLKGNAIGTNGIHVDAFKSPTGLTKLNLGDNDLMQTLQVGTFSSLHDLKKLWLHQNKIESLNRKILENQTSLIDLQINDNLLTDFAEGTLSHLINLDYLNMRDNLFTEIKKHYFSGLAKLTELEMEGNQIHTIEQNSFQDNILLSILEIDKNQLQTWSYDTFGASTFYLNGLLRIQVKVNPLHCGCHMMWMKEKEEEGIISFGQSIPECSTPADMAGLSWNNIKGKLQQLICDSMSTIVYFLSFDATLLVQFT